MKINVIQNIPAFKPQIRANRLPNLFAVQDDTFVKTTSFKGNEPDTSFQAFKKWADETDFISKAEDIIGFEGMTIEIPDNDNWVLKILKRSTFTQQKTKEPEIHEIKDKLPDLNIGQMIAYVKIPISENTTRTFYVLRKQKGETYGINTTKPTEFNRRNIDMHLKSLQKIAEMPYSTYKQLINDIVKVNDAGYVFDCYNPNNIMVDDENKRINFVDVYDSTFKNNINYQFSGILSALLDGEFGTEFLKSCQYENAVKLAQTFSDIIREKFDKAVQEKME